MMRFTFLALAALLITTPAFAMDGVNMDSGDAYTVDDATTFNVGDTIALFDADGNEVDLQVQAVTDNGDVLDVDFVDPDSGDQASIEFTKMSVVQ